MALNIMETGKTVSFMERELWNTQMEIFTRGIGRMGSDKEKVPIFGLLEKSSMENGIKTRCMVPGL